MTAGGLQEALAYVDAPVLAALAVLTGDSALLAEDLVPDLSNPLDPTGGWDADKQRRAQALVATAFARWEESGRPVPAHPDRSLVRRAMDFTVGGALPDRYEELFREELGGVGEDPRAPTWRKEALDAERPFLVAIVGAGMSGLLAGHRLAQARVPYVILEKDDDVGGTWYENTYPGCRVDVANHFYSYSCFQKPDWPYTHSPQPVLHRYFRDFAEQHGVLEHVRLGTEVVAATYSEESCTWALHVRGPDGNTEDLVVQAVVMAVGQLNRPNVPDIPGLATFSGPAFHSARWDHDIDVAGKRVAVIGNGASAVQFIPEIAEQAARVTVFQRTPNWLVPSPDYQEGVPAGRLWLFRNIPSYNQWYRLSLFYRTSDGLLPATEVDPDWQGDGSVGPVNDLMRQFMAAYLEGQVPDPELREKLVPKYPPFAKRMLLDNGSWCSTLARSDVELVGDPIARIVPDGVVTADGTEHPADVLIYATGFMASDFLTPVRIVGRDGTEIHEHWDGEPRAYLGMTVPGYPNLFCLYGPNTNIVVNGSIIYFSECEVSYVLEALRFLLETGHGAIDVRPEVHDAYNVEIDAGNRRRVWGASQVNTWYKNRSGRITQNWPFSLQEYWERTRRLVPADYAVLDAGPAGGGSTLRDVEGA